MLGKGQGVKPTGYGATDKKPETTKPADQSTLQAVGGFLARLLPGLAGNSSEKKGFGKNSGGPSYQ